ncbi:MAG: putative Hybrid PKS-NRPS biosynthetic cluster [Bathelium mastoideum]|nr:MAG: putative Hybrid PKS-NRPS biosynthetic cluster [Bathelium mastoideum]
MARGTARRAGEMPNEPIAIVGSACRFPGESSSPSKLWDLLRQPRDVLKEMPIERFSVDGYYHPDNMHHGTSNVRHSYLLDEDVRLFDARFFGIKPVEANSIDPQQRLLLETVYEGIEAAGLKMKEMQGSQTAVYVGLMSADYADMLGDDKENMPTYFATGTARSIASNRVSYFFDWHGPSMTIDTACSSSLVAVHQAVQVLRSGDGTDVAVAAGVNLLLSPDQYIAESKLKMLSPDGRSQMWDEKANGYARGDGIACVVMKTLSQAIKDGDRIECLIRDTQINQDGKTKGITMPSATAQTALIRATYKKAGLDLSKPSDRPQFFEAHGTGTPAGDPIEAEAIHTAFFGADLHDRPSGSEPLYVGSIKTVIGHTEGTAGLAALLKASLALQNRTIPPNCLLDALNPKVQPFYGDLQIATRPKPWPELPQGTVRRASVNSFGFGGANAHAILEAYEGSDEEVTEAQDAASHSVYTPLNFSANSETSLRAILRKYAAFLDADESPSLRDLSWTLNNRRSTLALRTSVYGGTAAELAKNLIAKSEQDMGSLVPVPAKSSSSSKKPCVLGVFTGQGAQWARMGAQLIITSPAVSSILDRLEQSLADLPDGPSWSIKAELFAEASTSRINEAAISQPLCTAVQIVLVDLLRSAGIEFAAVVGHSSGEMGAAYAAGYLSASDAIRIAYYRGYHLHLAQGPNGEDGAMMAVGTSFDDAQELCDLPAFTGRMSIAASNSSASLTLSGDKGAVEWAKDVFDDEKKFARLLKVDKAYHSHHMLACSDAYSKSLADCKIQVQKTSRDGTIWISSVYGEDATEYRQHLSNEYWVSNMVSPVLFSNAVEFAVAEKGPFDIAIELGPHPALKGPALQVLQEVATNPPPYTGLLSRGVNDNQALAEGFGYIWQALGDNVVNFSSFDRFIAGSDAGTPKLLPNLPSYAWDHEHIFWHESRQTAAIRTKSDPTHELLGTKCPDGAEQLQRWRNMLRPKEIPWLAGHQIQGQMVFPAAGYISAAFEAVKIATRGYQMRMIEVEDFVIGQAIVFNEESSSIETQFTLTDISFDQKLFTAGFSFYSASSKNSQVMVLNASGKISVVVGDSPADALPSYPGPEFNLLEVDADRFYTSLEKLGFGYTGPFRALENLQRKMGSATGVIRNPQSTDPAYNLLLHPATIDCAIQSIILAYCYPNDGRLWSVHLPTRIKKLRIDPRLCEVTAGREVRLNFKSTITSGRSSEIEGDVDIYDEEGRKTMMQLEGMHTKPLQHATAENDALLFSEAVWAIDGPSRELAASNKPDFHDQSDFSLDVERVAFYYLRHLDDVATSADREKAEWHHKILFEYIDHTVSSVRNRTAQFANRDWLHDTPEQIEHIIRKYPGSIDMRLMRTVGEHLIPVIRGETTMLEYMREDDLLNAFYADALGFREYTDTLAQQVSQLGHRYPHMDILEIGAGTGGATRRIFDRLDKRFGSYTYTDISAGFFENAMKLFEDFVPSMSFKALNIEKDPIEQGFQEHSYDLIVASLVLHATHEMETTMKNVRRLLKPGGYLIMLELSDPEMRFGLIFGSLPGWWMGYDDGRKLSPCMVEQDWDACMRKTGFAGVDAIVPRQPTLPVGLTVITGQAVDERVAFLREPLASNNLPVVGPHLTIVGGTTARIMEMAEKATAALKPFYKSVIHVKSFAELSSVGLPFMGTALCLTDLDKALFYDLTAEQLKGVQQLFKQAKNILWVTQGCRRDNPYSNMSVGLGRVLILEMTHLRLQYLNFESASELATDVIMGKLLQLEATELWNQSGGATKLLWSVEPELTFDKGHFLVPRIILNPARNDRYNSSRRHITKDMDPASSNLSLRWSGAAYEVHEETQAVSSSEFDGTVDVEVSYSTLDAIKVTSMDYLYLVLGTNTRSKDQVLALSANRSSIVRVQGQCTLPCNMPVEDALQLMPLVRNYLIALATFADLPSGETLVLLEPEEMLASVVSRIAAEKGIKAMHITTRDDAKGDNWKFIHPNAPRRTIESALPKTAFTFVTCVANDKVATNLTTCLPPNCQVRQPGFFTTKEAKLDPFYSSAFVPSTFRSAFARAHHDAKLFAKATSSIIAAPEISPDNQPPAGSMLFRWTSPARVQITPVDYQPLFSPDKTYWLVGLTSGLGLSLCEWMVKHGAKHIALTSRNPKVDPRWEARMGEHNATIKIYKNDITDRESVAATYRMICAELPPVAGVAQGAMALDDALFDDLSLEQVHRVIRPKVDGCVYLEEIFAETKLEFFVFFSSMASVAGNQGQSMYAAANSYMTALAAQRRHRGLAGSAINIGAIVGNGYVTRELTVAKQEYLTSMGNIFMSEQDFHQIFAEGVVAGRENAPDVPEIMTGLRMARMDDADKVTWFYNPKFSHCVLWPEGGANEAATSKQNVSVKAQLLMATTPEAVVETIQDAFVGKLKSSLQIDASVSIVNMGADELGLDSLVAVDIRSWFIKELNVEMPVLKVLGGFTVAELVADAVEKLPESFIPNIGKEAPKVTPGAQTAEPVSSQEEKISFAKDDNYAAFDEEEDADGSDDEASTVSSGSLVILDHAKASETLPPHPSALKHTDIPANLDFLKPKSQGAASKRMTPVSATPAESMIESKSSSSDTAQTSDSESGSLRRSGISTATSLSIIRDEISKKDDNVLERVVPMSFGQKRFWFLKHYLEDQTAFNITTSIRLEGRLKVEDFARAVKAVGRRHEALRTAFFTDKNNQAMQGVLREPVLALEHCRIHQEDEIAIEYARIKNNSYDIGRGETMKIVLLSLSESLHQLIIAYHHINMDGISLEVLIRDLQQYYYHKKPANETLQYPDYTLIQAKEHASGQWRNELAFWRSEFETIPEPLPILPISNKTVRSPLTKYASHTVKFTIDPAVSSQIQKACSRTKASPFNFYLAAFKALLYRWAGEDCTDICIGMADGGRNNEDVSDSVGFFLNLLPLRFRVQSSQTFNDALKEARSKVVSALANSKVPFDVLLNEINVPRTSTYSPVFQAFINYRQGVQDSRPFCGCQGTATQFDGSQTAYDISIDILDNPGGHSAVYLAGQSALYSESDVELLAQSYHQLIKAFAKNPASRLSRPSLHDPSAAERALDLGRGPTKAYEWPETLIHRIDEMTTLHASKIALKGPKSRLTYSQMAERMNAIASVLESNSMQKGSRIGVFQDPGSDFICCMLAIIRIGAIFVPLEPRLTIARVADIVKDSALDTIVFDKANQGDLNELGSNFRKINVSLVPTKSSTQIPNKANADGTAIILYTSGSTGKPKGILFSNQSWRNQIESTSHAWHVNCDAGVHLQQSAWSFDISISQTFLALANGCSLYIVPKDKRGDSRAISNIVVTEGVTFAQATPSELVSWLESGDSNALQKSRWQFAMSGGEAMTSALIQRFRKLAKGDLKLVNAYGPAETTLAIGSAEVRYATDDSLADPLQLFPNYSVYILAPNRQPVPPGMPGEVYIGGAGVAQGYLNNDTLNKERFLLDELAPTEYSENKWTKMHKSGDRGRLSMDGGLILEGRIDGDTQIKLRGIRIDLRDIESAIFKQADGNLKDVAVSVHRSQETEHLVAHAVFSVSFTGEREPFLERLRTSLPLPQYMQPVAIIPLDRLPTNHSGKIDRKVIASLPLLRSKANEPVMEQRHDPETTVKEIWQEVLGEEVLSLHVVGSNSDFFHVGGSSMALVKVQARINSKFHLDLPLIQLFENSTLGGMTKKIVAASGLPEVATESTRAPIPSIPQGSQTPSDVHVSDEIDWEEETALTNDLYDLEISPTPKDVGLPFKTVVLTGATGFLGQAILARMVEDFGIDKIHAIAVRRDRSDLPAIFSNSKIEVHSGDLSSPRLGLSEAKAVEVFGEADAVIHNGADVSFLKTYRTLSKANVGSTRELMKFCLPRRVPVHYISSASVAHLSGKPVFGEESVAPFEPPKDGSDGYTASKWASERFLERMSEKFLVPIWIHRPSSVTGDNAPTLDLMSNLLNFSKKMRKVPKSPAWKGSLDFVGVETVASQILDEVKHDNAPFTGTVRYVYESGDLEIAVQDMQRSLEKETGERFETLNVGEWTRAAKAAGLDALLAEYLIGASEVPIVFPRLLRSAPPPRVAPRPSGRTLRKSASSAILRTVNRWFSSESTFST